MDMLKLLAWFLVASVLVVMGYVFLVSGSAIGLIARRLDWKRWPAIRRARRGIRDVARQRVPNAEVVSVRGATAMSPGYLSFCIRTDTDKDRDFLRQDPEIHQQVRKALARAGYPTDTAPVVHFGIESQETVDRDYGGTWDEASQMP